MNNVDVEVTKDFSTVLSGSIEIEQPGDIEYLIKIKRTNQLEIEYNRIKHVFCVVPSMHGIFKLKKSQIAANLSPLEKILSVSITELNRERLNNANEEIKLISRSRLSNVVFRERFLRNKHFAVKDSLRSYFYGNKKREELTLYDYEKIFLDNDDLNKISSALTNDVIMKEASPKQKEFPKIILDERTVKKPDFLNRDYKSISFCAEDISELPEVVIYLYHEALQKQYNQILERYHFLMREESLKEEPNLFESFTHFTKELQEKFPLVWLDSELSNCSSQWKLKKEKTRSTELYLFERLNAYNQQFNFFQKSIGVSFYLNGQSYDDFEVTKSSSLTICAKSASNIVTHLNYVNNVSYIKWCCNAKTLILCHCIDNFKEEVKNALKVVNYNSDTDKLAYIIIPKCVKNYDGRIHFNSGINGIDENIEKSIGQIIYNNFVDCETFFSEISKMCYTTSEQENSASSFYSQVGSIFLDLERKDSANTLDMLDLVSKILFRIFCSSHDNYKIDNVFCLDHGIIKQIALIQDAIKYCLSLTEKERKEQFNLVLDDEKKKFLRMFLKIIPSLDCLHVAGASMNAIVNHSFLCDEILLLHTFMTGMNKLPTIEKKVVYYRELIGTLILGAQKALTVFEESTGVTSDDLFKFDKFFEVVEDILFYTAPFIYYMPFIWVNRTNNEKEVMELLSMMYYTSKKLGCTNYENDILYYIHFLINVKKKNKEMHEVLIENFKFFHESKIELGHNDISNIMKKNVTSDLDHVNKSINALSTYQSVQKFKQEFFGIENRKAYSWWRVNIKEKNIQKATEIISNFFINEYQKRKEWKNRNVRNSFIAEKDERKYKTDRYRLRIIVDAEEVSEKKNGRKIVKWKGIDKGFNAFMMESEINNYLDDVDNLQKQIKSFYGNNTTAKSKLIERRNKILLHLTESLVILFEMKEETASRCLSISKEIISSPLYSTRDKTRTGSKKMNLEETAILEELLKNFSDYSFIPKKLYQEVGTIFYELTGIIKKPESIIQFRSHHKNLEEETLKDILEKLKPDILNSINSFLRKTNESYINTEIELHKKNIRDRNIEKQKTITELKENIPCGREYFCDIVPESQSKIITNFENRKTVRSEEIEQKLEKKIRKFEGDIPDEQSTCCLVGCDNSITLKYKVSSLKMEHKVKKEFKKNNYDFICFKCYKRDREEYQDFISYKKQLFSQDGVKFMEIT